MATKTFNSSWVAIYRGATKRYHSSGTPMRIGGYEDDTTFIGLPTSVRDALESAIPTGRKLKMRFYVTDSGAGLSVGSHNESYNKASGSMPAFTNHGLTRTASSGWNEIDITSVFVNNYLNGSKEGIVLHGAQYYILAVGKTSSSTQVQFIVEGTWNTAPEAPSTFNSPKSSVIADESVAMSWTAGSDAQSTASTLRYELAYYNGSAWIEDWTLGAGVRSYTYPTADKPETSRARFRVRTVDPQNMKSGWTYSDYFVVSHNKPPLAPSNLAPRGGKVIDRNKLQRMTWKHNDDGAQAGYQIAWRTVNANGTFGNFVYFPNSTDYSNSTSQYHDYVPNTWTGGEIEWTVRTKDQRGEVSPWSARERFFAGEQSDAPIFVNPEDGAILNVANFSANWSSLDQIQYEIKLLSSTGSVLWSENKLASNKATPVGYTLTNNTTYTLTLRVVNAQSLLWSSLAEVTFTTAFTPPAKPLVTTNTVDDFGEPANDITVSWEAGTGSITPVSYMQLMRRSYDVEGENDWVLIGDNLSSSGAMVDSSPASETTYEYKVRAWGANETYTDSDIAEGTVYFDFTFLQRAQVLTDLIVINVESRSEEPKGDGVLFEFANRPLGVFEFGVQRGKRLMLDFSVDSNAELRNIVPFLERKETFLYRDNVGRKFYCIIDPSIKIKDKPVKGFDISLVLEQVDYDEGFEVVV